MNRILDLQKLEQPDDSLAALARSTSSANNCTCSTRSGSCSIKNGLVVI